jgi:hypothetical protein
MSKFREDCLEIIAVYCQNHTNIDVYDIVATYAAASLCWKGEKREAAINRITSGWIREIKSMPEEYFEGEYSKVMQDRWDIGVGNPHYYCSKICPKVLSVNAA